MGYDEIVDYLLGKNSSFFKFAIHICYLPRDSVARFSTASAVYIRPRKPYISNNYLDFLGEFEAIFETALAHESGP
jgi:hypothetical protein